MMKSTVRTIVCKIWDDPNTQEELKNIIINMTPFEERVNTHLATIAFLASLNMKILKAKGTGDVLIPHFNIYTNRDLIKSDELWMWIRDSLATKTYHDFLQGKGSTKVRPFTCAIYHGIDHLRGLCEFPLIEGWNGPKCCIFMGRNGPRSRNTCGG